MPTCLNLAVAATQPVAAEWQPLTPLEWAELAILAAGVVLLLAVGLALAAQRRLGAFLRPAPLIDHDIGVFDIALTAWLFVFTPIVVGAAVRSLSPATVSDDPLVSRGAGLEAVSSGPAPTTSAAEARVPTRAATSAPAKSAAPAGRTPGQVVPSIVSQVLLAPLLMWLGIRRFAGPRRWGLTLHGLPRDLSVATLCFVAVWPVCSGLMWLSVYISQEWLGRPIQEHAAIETLLSPATPSSVRLLTAFSAVVLAPIVEELAFRGLLLPGLARATGSAWTGILATAALFGLIHAPVAHTVPSLVVFGAVLGFAYLKTRSLTLVILIHAVFNAKTVLWIFLGATPGP